MSDNSKLIKQLTAKKPLDTKPAQPVAPPAPKKSSEFVKTMKAYMPSKKTMLDVSLFAVTVYVIYEYGKNIASFVEEAVPTEQGILDAMQQQQAMMMPPPM